MIISGIRTAATESKHQITSTKSQIEKLEEENKLLKVQINEERLNNSRLEAQSKNLQSSLELTKSNEVITQNQDLKVFLLKNVKIHLRKFVCCLVRTRISKLCIILAVMGLQFFTLPS